MYNPVKIIKNKLGWGAVFILSTMGVWSMCHPQLATSATLSSISKLGSHATQATRNERQLSDRRHFSQAWLVLLPFQNAPGPNTHGPDPHKMKPFYKQEPSKQRETHQSGIRFDRCLDTDTCLLIHPAQERTSGVYDAGRTVWHRSSSPSRNV